jgi:ABC-type transport system involved in multi-copper enzyme maturation permease subunit
MKQRFRNVWLLAWTLMLEAWRRREIYIIVAVTVALIAGLRMVHFFNIEGLGKFYREICLKSMNLTTGLTVIFLAARQLPREFTNRTIYPLLAKPVSRMEFLLGKYLESWPRACSAIRFSSGSFCWGVSPSMRRFKWDFFCNPFTFRSWHSPFWPRWSFFFRCS